MADNLTVPGVGIVTTEEQADLSHIQAICLKGPAGEIIPATALTGLGVHLKAVDGNVPITGGFLTDAQLRAAAIQVLIGGASAAAISSVAASLTSVQLRPAVAGRKGLILYNNVNARLRICYVSPASLTNVSYPPIAAEGYFEMPGPHPYSGAIFGIWEDPGVTLAGSARITELS